MKILSLIILATVGLLAGCESMSDRMEDRFAGMTPHTRVFAAGQKAVYYAAQKAVKNVGLQLGRTSIANWTIDAYTAINAGNPTQDTRQTSLAIRLSETETGDTAVDLVVSEQTEGKFPGGVSQQPLRDHSLYEIYFTALQQVLLESGALKSVEKH